MRHYLLPEEGSFYKANLHNHSKFSDGQLTPAQLKGAYQQKGYSIIAFTDHDFLYHHNELTDDNFVALTSYEISVRSDDDSAPRAFRRMMDMGLIAKDPYTEKMVYVNQAAVENNLKRGKITEERSKRLELVGAEWDRHYYQSNVNRIIRLANENGFLVAINHPMWSMLNFYDYAAFEGAWAVEVYNHGCYETRGLTDSEEVFEDMLRCGKEVFCIATDDNHNGVDYDGSLKDSFGGFTMIKAKELTYASVIEAMENGWFYASTGPEIKELYYEDGLVHIKCSPCADICMLTMGRQGRRYAAEDGSLVTEATFEVKKDIFGYIRFRLRDQQGQKAWSNCYYVDQLDSEAIYRRTIWDK